MEKVESVDSIASDCGKTGMFRRTTSGTTGAGLPARIVVQNPAGDVTLGEDMARLKNEVADAQKKHEAHTLEAMQPGGERWAQVAYHQYWLSLCVTLQARKRLMLSPIGVDMGAMLWPVLSIILRQYGIQLGYEETLPVWALLSLSATCFLLDIATLLACSQDSQIVLVLVTVAHVPLYVSMFAANLNKNLWVLTRLLVFVCALRVLAVLREITWLETRYHEGAHIQDGWLTRLIVWSLSSAAKRNREQLIAATAEQQAAVQDEDERDVEEDMVSVYIGAHTPMEISSSNVSLSLQSISVDRIPSPPLVVQSAVPPQQPGGFDRWCTHSPMVQLGGGSDGVCSSSSPSEGEGRTAGAGVLGEADSMRLEAAVGRETKSDAHAESLQAAAAARGAAALTGNVGDSVVPGQGCEESDSFLSREDSGGTMCTAESSLQTANTGFGFAREGTGELCEVHKGALDVMRSDEDVARS